jgi:hypothetical protein
MGGSGVPESSVFGTMKPGKTLSLDAVASGFWVSESSDPKKALVLPQQVKILCSKFLKECTEISVTLSPVPTLVGIEGVDNTIYDIDQRDDHGLTASYGGDESSRCQRHVLTMDFESGAVSVSDIPTHKTGCEAFTETDSYKLVRGGPSDARRAQQEDVVGAFQKYGARDASSKAGALPGLQVWLARSRSSRMSRPHLQTSS